MRSSASSKILEAILVDKPRCNPCIKKLQTFMHNYQTQKAEIQKVDIRIDFSKI